jgi:CBS domain-containing protein
MYAFDERMLVVTDRKEGRLFAVGMVTEREFMSRVVALRADPTKVTLQDIMRRDFAFVAETDPVLDTVRWMRRNRFREAVVLGETGGLIGIVTLEQLCSSMAEEFAASASPGAAEPVELGHDAIH